MIFSGVDDLGDRLVVDAQIRRDAVQRRLPAIRRSARDLVLAGLAVCLRRGWLPAGGRR
jgi:hypothetical protein